MFKTYIILPVFLLKSWSFGKWKKLFS